MSDYVLYCDFCGRKDPPWLYPCESFDPGFLGIEGIWSSRQGWMACNACADVIDRGLIEWLMNRVRGVYRHRLSDKDLDLFMAEASKVYKHFMEIKGEPYKPDDQERQRLAREAAASKQEIFNA